MNQFGAEGVNEQIARWSTSDDDADVIKDQPFDGGDEFGIDGGQFGSDPERRLVGIGPWEEEDSGAVGEEDGVCVDGGEKVGVVDHPTGFSGSEFAQFFAGYAS